MIRRGKTTYFLDTYENTKVVEVKKMLECLTRQLAGDMRLFRENEVIWHFFPIFFGPRRFVQKIGCISQAAQSRCTVVRPMQKSIGKWEIRLAVKS